VWAKRGRIAGSFRCLKGVQAASVDELAQVEGLARRWRKKFTRTPLVPLNIPNLLTWLRILLIPVFAAVFYLRPHGCSRSGSTSPRH